MATTGDHWPRSNRTIGVPRPSRRRSELQSASCLTRTSTSMTSWIGRDQVPPPSSLHKTCQKRKLNPESNSQKPNASSHRSARGQGLPSTSGSSPIMLSCWSSRGPPSDVRFAQSTWSNLEWKNQVWSKKALIDLFLIIKLRKMSKRNQKW